MLEQAVVEADFAIALFIAHALRLHLAVVTVALFIVLTLCRNLIPWDQKVNIALSTRHTYYSIRTRPSPVSCLNISISSLAIDFALLEYDDLYLTLFTRTPKMLHDFKLKNLAFQIVLLSKELESVFTI